MIYLLQDQFIAKEKLRLSVDDRGYYFGDGVYEVFRVYNGMIFEKDAHLQRLARSAEAIKLSLPYSSESLSSKLEQLVKLNQLSTGIIYMQITRGVAPRSHSFPSGAEPVLHAYVQSYPRPEETMAKGIHAMTMEDIRWHRCDIKSLNLLPNTLARQEAMEQGFDEAILHRDGRVTECSASNIMAVQKGQILTHPADNWILHGITRAVVIRLAQGLGIPVQEEAFRIEQLCEFDELFITGTTVEVTPIISVDGTPIGPGQPGPVVRQLQDEFNQLIG